MSTTTFANILNAGLTLRGLTERQLATRLGRHHAEVSRFAGGDRVPTAALLNAIGDELGWDAEEKGRALQAVAAFKGATT